MKNSKWYKFFPIIGYLLVIVVVFGEKLAPLPGQLIFGDDIHRQYYFYRDFFNYFARLGVFPWWNPYLFSGEPFIANPVVNIWYPLNWLFIFLPLNLAYSLHLAFHIIIAMLGMRWLLKRIIGGIGEIEAWVAGLVFGLSGFFMARVWAGHVDVIAAASWMPWVFGAFYRLVGAEVGVPWFSPRQGPDRPLLHHGPSAKAVTRLETAHLPAPFDHPQAIVLASTIFALQLYAGYQTMAFFTLEAIGIVILLYCFFVKSLKPLFRAVLAGVLGLGLAGLQLIPEQEFFRSSIRTYSLPYSWNAYGAITFESLKQLINPFYFGDQLTYRGPAPNFIEHAMFVGIVALALTCFSLFKLLKSFKKLKMKAENLPIVGFAVITIFGLWMSLGPNAPLDLQKVFWQVIPMYHYLRIPSRHLVLFVFGVSALAGIGLSELKLPKLFKWGIVGLILFELVPFARHFIALKEVPELRHDKELISLLRQDKEPYRVLPNFGVWVYPRDSFDFDSSMSYRLFNATGYDPSILRRYYEFFDAVNGNHEPSILTHDVQVPYLNVFSPDLDFLNIKYIFVQREADPLYGVKSDRFVLAREDAGRHYRLYENRRVLPRFFFVGKAEFLSQAETRTRLTSGTVDLGSTVLIDEASAGVKQEANCRENDRSRLSLASYTPNRIVLKVKAVCQGYLVSSEVWYPGWGATVDNQKVPILLANLSFRALAIAPGEHMVVFTYSPTIFYGGALVSLVTLAVSGAWLLKTHET